MKRFFILSAAVILVLLLAGSCIFTFNPDADGYIEIYNDSYDDIYYVKIVPAGAASWGNDWLGTSIIESYSYYTFTVSPGYYDIRVEEYDYMTDWDAVYDVYVSPGSTTYLTYDGYWLSED